jgi:hypothetical protein
MLFAPIYLWARFASVEKLVLLGTDYVKADGWHTRFKLNSKNGPLFIPAALKDRTGKMINEVEFADPSHFFKKLEKTLKNTYSKQPYLLGVMNLVGYYAGETFGQYCSRTTKIIAKYLGLDLQILDVDGLGIQRPENASEWLAVIGSKIGGTTYVCAADAMDKYLEGKPFCDRMIGWDTQNYQMPAYDGSTDASVSILDLLARFSWKEIRSIIG